HPTDPCTLVTTTRVDASVLITDTATTALYTLSLHDALPICPGLGQGRARPADRAEDLARRPGVRHRQAGGHPDRGGGHVRGRHGDRKSTRLNSSHVKISYAVFCLKKKKLPHLRDQTQIRVAR